MNYEYEPIGTIVKLHNNDNLIMISGYKFCNPNNGYNIEDYIGVMYPNGLSMIDKNILFSQNDIEKVIFKGYKLPISNDKLLVNSEKPVSKYLFDENGIVIGINKKEDSNSKQELKFANDGSIIGF